LHQEVAATWGWEEGHLGALRGRGRFWFPTGCWIRICPTLPAASFTRVHLFCAYGVHHHLKSGKEEERDTHMLTLRAFMHSHTEHTHSLMHALPRSQANLHFFPLNLIRACSQLFFSSVKLQNHVAFCHACTAVNIPLCVSR
jgi:hypothetical protein